MRPLWRAAYVALGSNLDEPHQRVVDAFARLGAIRETRLELRSRLYRTRPMGPQDQPEFINAAAGVTTRLTARELLDELLNVERAMGRVRRERWGPRTVDLDLIWMTGAVVNEPGLTLPHPGVSTRNFVLYPLSDIAPTLHIPGHGRVVDLKSRVDGDGIAVLELEKTAW